MKEDIILGERLSLLEKELSTAAEKLAELEKALAGLNDLRLEIKGLKVFIGRLHPEFKKDFLEIMKKVQ